MSSRLPGRPKKRNYGVRISMVQRVEQRGVVRVASTRLPTMFGMFDLIGFERVNVDTGETESALLLTLGDLHDRAPLLRIPSRACVSPALPARWCFRETRPNRSLC